MKSINELSKRDLELISAYLDGELSDRDVAVLEARLKIEPQLREALKELKGTSELISTLPQVQPPRNFMLTPEMVGIRQRPSLYPIFRFASVVAAMAFAVVIGADTIFLDNLGGWTADRVADVPEVMMAVEHVQESEVLEAPAEAPVEKPAAVEALITPTVVVEAETIVEGESERTLEDPPPMAGVTGTEEAGYAKVDETQTDQAPNIITASPEDTVVAPEDALEEDTHMAEEEQLPTQTAVPIPSPNPTEIRSIEPLSAEPGIQVEPIHAVEAVLGLLALIFGGIAIYLRRQS